MPTNSTIVLILIILSIFISCSDNTTKETIKPVITITSPDSNQVIYNTNTIAFDGTISDNDALLGFTITIQGELNTLTNTRPLYFEYSPVVNGLSTYTLNTSWVATGITDSTNQGLITIFAVDKSDNSTAIYWPARLRP